MTDIKHLVISICISGIVGIAIYLYFKNRLSNLEFKLDTLYQLVQSHTNDVDYNNIVVQNIYLNSR